MCSACLIGKNLKKSPCPWIYFLQAEHPGERTRCFILSPYAQGWQKGLQKAHSIHLFVINASGLGAWSQPLRDSISGSSYESTDTPYNRWLQDAHGLPLLVHGARGGGAWSQPIKYSTSGSLNESADTPYDPVGGTQGPQEAHGKHLFVPSAGAVGQINMTHG